MNIEEAIQQFRQSVIEKGEFCEDTKRDHLMHGAISAAFYELCAFGSKGRAAFDALLNDASPFVRTWVAAQLLSEGKEEAKSVLKDIQHQGGILGIDAEMTLKEYAKGCLGSPFSQ